MSTIVQDVGRKLRTYRRKMGMTQEELAEKAELHYTYIGQVERGEKNLTLVSMEKILNALGVSFTELFDDIGLQADREEPDFASQCYTLICDKEKEDQERIYHILCEIEMLMK